MAELQGGCWRSRQFLLKGPPTDLHEPDSLNFIAWWQHWVNQGQMGRNWIVWHQSKNSGVAFSQIGVLAGVIVPMVGPPTLQN